jgi:peptidoglycan/LPS O-acetylase OafA/YrhL
MHKQRLIVLGLALLGVIGSFLPWASTPFGSVSGTDGSDGYITIILFIIPAVFSLIGNREESMKNWMGIVGAVFGLLGSLVGYINYSNVSGNPMGGFIKIGIGLYLILAAGVLLAILIFVMKGKKTDSTV